MDTERIWAHDELTKENRECVMIQPFTNFKGDQALCQVIFSGSGHNSHMCPIVAKEKIPNLLISVNKSGYSDHKTLHAGQSNPKKKVLKGQMSLLLMAISPDLVLM